MSKVPASRLPVREKRAPDSLSWSLRLFNYRSIIEEKLEAEGARGHYPTMASTRFDFDTRIDRRDSSSYK